MEIFKKGKLAGFIIALFLVLLGVMARLIPHAPNFTPIAAIALFSAVYLPKKTAIILPIAAMFVSDIFIGFYDFKIMAAVYGSFILSVILGFWLKRHKKWHTVGGAAILCGILFFLVTNFAVWAFSPWYAKTFSGLVQCYIMALPFLKNTLLGNIFYIAVFFGAYEAVSVWVKKLVAGKNALAPVRQ